MQNIRVWAAFSNNCKRLLHTHIEMAMLVATLIKASIRHYLQGSEHLQLTVVGLPGYTSYVWGSQLYLDSIAKVPNNLLLLLHHYYLLFFYLRSHYSFCCYIILACCRQSGILTPQHIDTLPAKAILELFYLEKYERVSWFFFFDLIL